MLAGYNMLLFGLWEAAHFGGGGAVWSLKRVRDLAFLVKQTI